MIGRCVEYVVADRGLAEAYIAVLEQGGEETGERASEWAKAQARVEEVDAALPVWAGAVALLVACVWNWPLYDRARDLEVAGHPRSLGERFGDWREWRRRQKATAAAWAEAETFTDLCGLTAQWLEGELTDHPGGYDEPAEETIDLVPFLADLNRGGFLTFGSQPGRNSRGYDGAGWRQRAAVHGFVADPAVLQALSQAAVDARLWIVIQAPASGPQAPAFSFLTTSMDIVLSDGPGAGDDEDGWVVVTTRAGEPCTDFGGQMPASYIQLSYGDWCGRTAVDAVSTARQLTIIDPIWGRDDLLWPTLTKALTDLTTRTALTAPTNGATPREDTGR